MVTLELVKVFQGYFLSEDEDMVANEHPVKINTFNINEDLG
jgi:hypothetical protein